MSTVSRPRMVVSAAPALAEGRRLDQPTFHACYEATPPGTKAELIGGIVSMPSPLGYEHSFASRDGRLVAVPPDGDGLFRSGTFPGLWLDPSALLRGDRAGVREPLGRGPASPEHAEFVGRPAAARATPPA